jgi:hypothetical protein
VAAEKGRGSRRVITFACVWTGNKYDRVYVERLRSGIRRHCPSHIKYDFVCLTDKPNLGSWSAIDIGGYNLDGWWNKLTLFESEWREDGPVIYFDLDMVITGDLSPLAALAEKMSDSQRLAICANFTRAAGHPDWPCRYGSCAMILGGFMDDYIWRTFWTKEREFIADAGRLGDQYLIEYLEPNAMILQEHLPKNFFVGYRDFAERQPEGNAVAVFAGRHRPDNCQVKRIRNEWIRAN